MELISGKLGAGPNRGWNLVRIAVAVVLLIAAGLKTHQLATEPTLGKSILESRWFLMATVEFELFFGLWLLSGLLPKQTWIAAIGCFGIFTCVSLYKALSGYSSCGCFGSVQVNPWYTCGFDLAIMASLLKWRPRQLPSPACGRGAGGEGCMSSDGCHEVVGAGSDGCVSGGRLSASAGAFVTSHSAFISWRRASAVLLLWLGVGLPAAIAMGSYTDTTLSNAGQIIGNGKIVVLEPEKWIGKRFPLLDYIDIGDRLKEGKWLVLLYHHDCPDCRTAVPSYKQLARDLVALGKAVQVALIEVPPYGGQQRLSVLPGKQCKVGRLSDAKEWFVTTPQEVILDGAVVKNVGDGKTPSLSGMVRNVSM